VLLHPVAVDAPEAQGELGGEDEADGHRLAVAQVVARPAVSSAWPRVWP
jgi:hypothetical protein